MKSLGLGMALATAKPGAVGTPATFFVLNYNVTSDTTAPTLSSPTGAKTAATTYSGTVTTDEALGDLKWIAQPATAATPSTLQIDLGLDGDGNPAPGGLQTLTVTATGVQNVTGDGLTNGVEYKLAFYQEDNAGNQSAVSLSASFGAVTDILYLGQVVRTGYSSGSIDITPLGLAQDDIVVVFDGVASNASRGAGPQVAAGYTDVDTDLSSNDTYDSTTSVAYKFMGAVPDTSLTVVSTGASNDARRTIVRAYRGVDTATPMDVAAVRASGSNTANVAPGNAITPVTVGAMVIHFGSGASVSSTVDTFATPTDLIDWYSARIGSSLYSNASGIGQFIWASGDYTPEAWTGVTVANTDSWTAWRIALRPA